MRSNGDAYTMWTLVAMVASVRILDWIAYEKLKLFDFETVAPEPDSVRFGIYRQGQGLSLTRRTQKASTYLSIYHLNNKLFDLFDWDQLIGG